MSDAPEHPTAEESDNSGITPKHAACLGEAFAELLGEVEPGTIAFTRALDRHHADALVAHPDFIIEGWEVAVVGDKDAPPRHLTADRAVEIREDKAERPTLFLIDAATAGAGLDGIYNAGREISERALLEEAQKRAFGRVKHGWTTFARAALQRARRAARRDPVTPWEAFDYAAHCAASPAAIGDAAARIGLWPVEVDASAQPNLEIWDQSSLLVDRLLGRGVAGTAAPHVRVEALRLRDGEEVRREVEEVARRADATSPRLALAAVAGKPHLRLGRLRPEFGAETLRTLYWKPWRSAKTKKLIKSSGLKDRGDQIPVFLIDPSADGNTDQLEVVWTTDPAGLPAGAVDYVARVIAGNDEVLAEKPASHAARPEQKVRFTNEDFVDLEEDQRFEARVEVRAIGEEEVDAAVTDEFLLAFGKEDGDGESESGSGRLVRCSMEGASALDIEDFDTAKGGWTGDGRDGHYRVDKKGFVTFRPAAGGRGCRVPRPHLLAEIERLWLDASAGRGWLGRWRIEVRGDGVPATPPRYVDLRGELSTVSQSDRVEAASRKFLGQSFSAVGGITGEIYSDAHPVVGEYLLAWENLLDAAAGEGMSERARVSAALAHTLEVTTQSGRPVGLIVLPTHPLRVAWHVGYDRLVQHARHALGLSMSDTLRELEILDGSQFPAYLPTPGGGGAYVFADMIGFQAAAMVAHDEREPRAAVARLATCYGGGVPGLAPTVGEQAGEMLGRELAKFVKFHAIRRALHVHAVRPGDGRTVARALADVVGRNAGGSADGDAAAAEDDAATRPELTCELQLFPSAGSSSGGRFLADVLANRRAGSGGIAKVDRWMLESVARPGGVTLPKLRWARREVERPDVPAHVAVAFDTFDSRIEAAAAESLVADRPTHAFGLLARSERRHDLAAAEPNWSTFLPPSTRGESHPAGNLLTRRLQQIHDALLRIAAGGSETGATTWPVLRTCLSTERRRDLERLHELCDWVVTIDRNVGVEFFDAPREAGDVYDAYVIDCVPERDDLGNLQLVTSTARTDDVRRLLDGALDRMGLSGSDGNVRFLLSQLKALSGRLAMRLASFANTDGELVALALAHAACCTAGSGEEAWLPASSGFFVPLDDVRDLDPPTTRRRGSGDVGHDGADGESDAARRADLLFVVPSGRSGLAFHFVEVKYRRFLGSAASPTLAADAARQADDTARRWRGHYFDVGLDPVRRAIRVSRLAAALRFYADKARRHRLDAEVHERLVAAIDRLVLNAGKGEAAPAFPAGGNRVYAFCPEFAGETARQVPLPPDANGAAWMFGPARLPETIGTLTRPDNTNTNGDGDPPPDGPAAGPLNDAPPTSGQAAAEPEQPNLSDHAPPPAAANDNAEAAGGEAQDPSAPAEPKDASLPLPPTSEPTSKSTSEPLAVHLGSRVLDGDAIAWQVSIRANPHLMLVGLPGMGKTTCLLNLCRQLDAADVTPIVFSYHQDFDEKVAGPLPLTRFLRPDRLGFNPLRIERPAATAHIDSAGMIRDIFAGIYPDLGDIQLSRIREAVKEAYTALGWGGGVPEDAPAPEFAAFYERLQADEKPDMGLIARLSELHDYGVFNGAGEGERLLESGTPSVLQIHANQNNVVQRAFASLLLYGLYKDMFRRGPQARITHAVIFDEAHRAAKLRLLPTMAKECRKYGIALLVASQEAEDFDDSLYSAIASYLCLRVTDRDAKAIASHCVSSDQKARTIDRLKSLDKYQGLFFREGASRPSHVRLSS
jgi:hypothetical protein